MMRREYLKAAALAAVASSLPLAGCTSQADPGDQNGTPERPTLPTEPDYRGWFGGVGNYRGETVDARGEADVTVKVGSSANGGFLGFSPAAVAVSPGTTVTWVWTGKGGAHNVHSESDAFDSGYSDHEGHEFSFTFEEPRIYKYQCDPHAMMGMKGAVVVTVE